MRPPSKDAVRAALRRWLRDHRGTPVADRIAELCRFVTVAYENYDWDFDTNGEARVLRIVGPHLAATTVLDVGANVGDWTAEVLRAAPGASVHAFEVVPAVHEQLARRFAADDRVRTNGFGLLDHTRAVEVAVDAGKSTVSSIVGAPSSTIAATNAAGAATVAGTVMTGDAYCRQAGIGRVGLLKVDTEGWDRWVLDGFRGLIGSGSIDVIQFEWGRPALATRVLLAEFYDLLAPAGYEVGKIYPAYVDFRAYNPQRHEDFIGLNYLAVRRDLIDLRDRLAARGG